MAVHESGPLEVRLDPKDFAQLLKDVRAFDRVLYTQMRKELRTLGNDAVKDVRKRILSGPSKQNAHVLRAGLAAGTKLSIRTGAKTAGVSIRTTGAKLPDGKKPMVRAYNKPSFRHPVFGDRHTWVTQTGRPYFGYVLNERKREMQRGFERVLVHALESIHGGEVNT